MRIFNLINSRIAFGLAFLLIFSSCLNDIDDVITTEERPEPSVLDNYEPAIRMVTGSVVVFVKDDNGDPVPGAEVKIGTATGSTDAYGHYFLNNVEMNALGTVVQVNETGYFEGSRRFFPRANSKSYVTIELIDKLFNHSFNSLTGGTVNLPGGASIVFDGETVGEDGQPYSGVVSVAAEWLNPAEPSTADRMPGNLQGVDEFNQEVALATYGMMAVELRGEGGEYLNLMEGESAQLTMPVPASLQTSALSEIPLWSYYEPLGLWVREGSATLQGNSYVGDVTHFSFWNCDAPFPLVEFQAQLVDTGGNPIANESVQIVTELSWWPGWGYTDANGIVSGLIPADANLTLQLMNICNEVIFNYEFTTGSDFTDLGTLTVPPSSGVNTTVVFGTLEGCGAPVTNGLVIAEFNGQTVYHYTDGPTFEFVLTTCSAINEVIITGVDIDELLQSEPVTIQANESTDVGQLVACDEQLEDYILMTIDGETAVFTGNIFTWAEMDSLGDITYTNIGVEDTSGFVSISFNGGPAGDYGAQSSIDYIQYETLDWFFQGATVSSFTVTEYGDVGGQITGSFSGAVQGPNGGATLPMDGVFNVIRDN